MRLYQLGDRCLSCSAIVIIFAIFGFNFCEKLDGVMAFLSKHLFVACLARENGLVDVAIVEATLALHILCSRMESK